jgi:hypothetical protein
MDGWIRSDELLAAVPLPGKRPDAVLKRLREAGILSRPRRRGAGRGRGITVYYPPGTDVRLARVVALRASGVRALPELRWHLWWEGADDLWPKVQKDLLAAYPRAEQAALEKVQKDESEELDAAVDAEAVALFESWDSRRLPGYDRRRVRDADAQTLAYATVGSAVGEPIDLGDPLDRELGSQTIGDVADRAWGPGAAETLDDLTRSGALRPEYWEQALRSAIAAQARLVVRIADPVLRVHGFQAEARRFGHDWADRALLVGSLLYAIEVGGVAKPNP